jgi:hypothetical protein
MNIEFEDNELEELQTLFNALGTEDAIFMNHYQLAQETGKPAEAWKRFLMHPAVSTWIAQELHLYKEHQLKNMIRTATDNDKSVGAAQMINALTKTLSEGQQKTGPVIIYTHVPLTEAQAQGTPVEYRELDENILAMIPQDWRSQYEREPGDKA